MPTRPADVAPDDAPDDGEDLLSELGELTDPGLAELLDTDRWADDEPDGEVPGGLEAPQPPSDEPFVDAPDDDEGSAIQAAVTEEVPLPSLDLEPVVIPWRGVVLVDGERTPMIADPTAALTTLVRPGGGGTQRVRIRARGRVVQPTIQVSEGPAALRIGRDVLAGRFLVASDDD